MGLFKKRAEKANNSKETKEEDILQAFCNNEKINWNSAMNVPAFSACMNLIKDTVSLIPIRLYKKNKNGEIKEVEDDIRTILLNDDTKDTFSGADLKRAITESYFRKGAFIYINKNGIEFESLNFVDDREISFIYSDDPIFKEYKILVRGSEYQKHDFIKILRRTVNGRESIDFLEENKEILEVAYASLLYEKNLVKTGGNKKGFIKSAHKLADEALKNLKEAWRKLYQTKTENVVILNDGLDFKESSNTSVEMQLNENKKSNSDEICKILNVPPQMISGSATEEDKIRFIQYCIIPILTTIEKALDRDLLLEKEKGSYFFAADTSELTKGDIKTRYEAYEIACKNGFLQIDEIRRKEKMPELGLDFIKLGLQDVIYDPKTKKFFIPNMNAEGGMGKEVKDDEDRSQIGQSGD